MLSKWSKDRPNINHFSTLCSLREAKYNKSELQNLQDLEETGKGLIMLNFKLGYCEEQLFMTLSVSSDKNWVFFYGRCPTSDFYKIVMCLRDLTGSFRAEVKC